MLVAAGGSAPTCMSVCVSVCLCECVYINSIYIYILITYTQIWPPHQMLSCCIFKLLLQFYGSLSLQHQPLPCSSLERLGLEKLGMKALMLWTDNRTSASNCKNNVEVILVIYNIWHFLMDVMNKVTRENLDPIPQENNIFIPDWSNQHLSHNQKYIQIQILFMSIMININIA